MRRDMSTSIRVPNLKSLALPVVNLGRIQKFINSAIRTPPRPLLGVFLIHKMGLARSIRVPNLKSLFYPAVPILGGSKNL